MMETKPFSLQSPESIAKEYGGNKQKIAEAMQMGIVDPTAGTLAGMFIDRMRSAQMQEQAPQQTVAQQVFNPQPPAPPPPPMGAAPPPAPPMPAAPPPAPPGGLGATPEAAQMGMGAPPVMDMPMGGEEAPSMAGGGIVGLPIPSSMFDEPDNGSYSRGGIVAFAGAGKVDEKKAAPKTFQQRAADIYKWDPEEVSTRMADIERLAPKETKYSDMQREYFEKELSPEAQEKRRKQDMWMSLAQIGSKMAQTPGSILQAASAGIGEALPGAQEAAKERRQDLRESINALAAQEGASNKERRELLSMGMAAQSAYQQAMLQGLGHDVSLQVARENNATELAKTRMTVGASMYGARMAAGAADRSATAASRAMATAAFNAGQAAALKDPRYMAAATAAASGDPKKSAEGRKTMDAVVQEYVGRNYDMLAGMNGLPSYAETMGGGGSGGVIQYDEKGNRVR